MESSEFNAIVIATFSRRMQLKLLSGTTVDARIKGKRLAPVCGDHVTAEAIADESDWLITAIAPRRNQLARPSARGHTEVLAANIDVVVVVAAATPAPDWFIVDRYISAAELMAAEPIVVFNKIDLSARDETWQDELSNYRRIGLNTIETSVSEPRGLSDLESVFAARRGIVVGQSGVGKSSLINAMTESASRKTAGISAKTREGRHTTVNSVMIDLKNSGQVIDSPGVRDYAPALTSAADVARSFRDIATLAPGCRFKNCLHLREPSCAVKAAIGTAKLSRRRYESFKRLLNLTQRLTTDRY